MQKLQKMYHDDNIDGFINALCNEKDKFIVNDIIDKMIVKANWKDKIIDEISFK